MHVALSKLSSSFVVVVLFLCGVADCQNLAGGAWSKSHSDLRNSAIHPFAKGLRSLDNTKFTKYSIPTYGEVLGGSVGFDTIGNAYYSSGQRYHRISPNGTVVSEGVSNGEYQSFYGGTSVTEAHTAVHPGLNSGIAIRNWETNMTTEIHWENTGWTLYGAGTSTVNGSIFLVDGNASLRQVALSGTVIASAAVAINENPDARSEFVTAATTGNGVFFYSTSNTPNTTIYAVQMPEGTVVWKYDTAKEYPLPYSVYYCSSSISISKDSSTVYLVTNDGVLFAFNATTGETNWFIELDCYTEYQVPIESPDGSIVVICRPNSNESLATVYGIQNGEVVHHTSFPAPSWSQASAAVSADGILYGSTRDMIYAFDLNTWTLMWTLSDSEEELLLTSSSFSIGNDGSIWTPNYSGALVSVACIPGYFIGENGVCIECPNGTGPSPTGCFFDCGMQQLPFHLYATCDCPLGYSFNVATLGCQGPSSEDTSPLSEPLESTDSSSVVVPIIIVLLALLVLVGVSIVIFVLWRRRKAREPHGGPEIKLKKLGQFDILDNITLKESIGKGAFGEVYLGDCDGTPCACKKLPNSDVEEAIKEAETLLKLSHPNIIRLIGIHVTESQETYLVLEYIKGGSLTQFLPKNRKALQVDDLVGIAIGVAQGMAYLERKHITHRDVAARNILVGEGNQPIVSDFGMSRDNMYQKRASSKIPVRWSAPEILQQGASTTMSDVFSFGVTLWEIFSFAMIPFGDLSNTEAAEAICNGDIKSNLQQPSMCPDDVYQLMIRCWSVEPSQRPSFQEALAVLQSVAKLESAEHHIVSSDEDHYN